MAGSTLPERVAQIYYTYGLFCSSYPVTAITLALSVVLLCCFPLLNVPLPGNIPTTVVLPLYEGNTVHHYVKSDCRNKKCPQAEPPFSYEILQNETQKLPHVWAKEKPLLYVQQIIMKIGVSPWTNNLKMWDAFRAPLQEVFRLLETVRNHEYTESKTSLAHRCYQIEGIKRRDSSASVERLLPEYGCLLLSPANLWQQNLQTFSLDANILNTIHTYHKGKPSISEMAFGMHLRDTGVKRYPLRRRPRVLQYAVTVFFEHYDQRFLQSLSEKLKEQYPLYQDSLYSVSEATLVYYPGQFNYRELVPLMITFVGLFLYVYFSVRKIEFINSKFGLAACAVTTIAGSLAMSMGICFYFGFSLSLQGKEIFPYLVIIVGLENVLVLTKSVTGTDSRLDVKIRLAQGLSKEGWSITKNLLTEITIFTVSFFTFVPFIQEFSIFMIVSLLSDYFVQMVFFATILGIDVRRMDYFREQNSKLHLKEYFHANNVFNWRSSNSDEGFSPQRMTKSKSHPRLNGLAQNSPTDVVAKRNSNSGIHDQRVPKRIRLVNLWARTRFFQRAFMVWMIVWISMIVYNSGVVEYFIASTEKSENTETATSGPKVSEPRYSLNVFYKVNKTSQVMFSPLVDVANVEKSAENVNDTILLKHSPNSRPWSRLSPYHWSSILSHYNQSLAGGYAVILPPLLLSHRVGPELAAGVRHPDEKDPPPLRWQALAAALDPIDIIPDFEVMDSKSAGHQRGQPADLPIYPTTPMEILLLAILCSISVAVIAYMMVVLYRCVCSRHYAEWRASWNGDESDKIMSKQPAVQLVMEAVPIVVGGHSHEVECISTDGERIVSSCLQGNIKVWDAQNGDNITNIDRAAYFKLQKDLYEKINSMKDSNNYEVEEVVPKQELKSFEKYPRLRKSLDSHLSGLRFRANQNRESPFNLPVAEKTKYEFAKNYRELYCSTVNDDYYSDSETRDNDISLSEKDSNSNRYKDSNCNESVFYKKSHSDSRKVNGSVKRSDSSEIIGNNSELIVNDNKIIVNNSEMTISNKEIVSDWRQRAVSESPVWCMDLCNNLIVLGCADGRLEFWEADLGKLLCIYWGEARSRASSGVTHVRTLAGARRVLAASLGGHLTLLRLAAVNAASGKKVDWTFSTAHRRTHKRTGSAGAIRAPESEASARGRMSFSYEPEPSDVEEMQCVRVAQVRAHQQPITELQAEGPRVLTAGQDHVLKVFLSSELSPLFTLHGHCGPVTSSFIDHTNPHIAGSGSQDGLLCVWDLHTGACLYSTQAHDGAVTSLAYTASYVISAGSDEKLCIWDRFQGHMLNSVHIGLNYMSRMLPLTHSLLVMGDRSGLVTYDLSSGDVIRRVLLGQSDGCIYVRQILPLKDAIVCDYANQLRIVRFPLVSRLANIKSD